MNFKVALAQIDSKVGNLQANLDHHLQLVDEAVRGGAQLVMFPELSLTGYTVRDLAWDLAVNPLTDPLFRPLKERSRSVSILLGFIESGPDHGIYNSALFLEDGEVAHVHRKIYPPTYGMFEEGRYFSPGKLVEAFDSKLGRFGILICEDLWHLSLPYLLAHDGAEAILTLTASPSRIAGGGADLQNARINHEQHRVYARLLSSYILFCNRVGFEDGVNFWGGSAVTNPSGETTVTGKFFAEDLVFGHIDSLEVRRARRLSRHFLDENLDLVMRNLARLRDAEGVTSAYPPVRRR
jgi:predicted amidohydrolase